MFESKELFNKIEFKLVDGNDFLVFAYAEIRSGLIYSLIEGERYKTKPWRFYPEKMKEYKNEWSKIF